jgi:hypothetical protein
MRFRAQIKFISHFNFPIKLFNWKEKQRTKARLGGHHKVRGDSKGITFT